MKDSTAQFITGTVTILSLILYGVSDFFIFFIIGGIFVTSFLFFKTTAVKKESNRSRAERRRIWRDSWKKFKNI